jgi:hypothetical protein
MLEGTKHRNPAPPPPPLAAPDKARRHEEGDKQYWKSGSLKAFLQFASYAAQFLSSSVLSTAMLMTWCLETRSAVTTFADNFSH